jgi:hydroxymethylpyrimidine/phosphomethylpyrimidine kinase
VRIPKKKNSNPSFPVIQDRITDRRQITSEYSGLEADQRVLAAHGCYALTATTGLTAQNTLGVQDIHVVPAAFVRKQIKAALEDIGADVVKLGES